MAKNSIRDFDNTAGNNTDVQSVDISEGCSPAGINNAIREVMADLADVNDGTVALTSPSADSMTVTGDLTVDTDTLKVDSTNNRVGIGTSSPSAPLEVNVSGASDALILTRDTGTNGELQIDFNGANANHNSVQGGHTFATNGTERMRIDSSGNVTLGAGGTYRLDINAPTSSAAKITCDNTPMHIGTFDSQNLQFLTGNTERMRVTTAGSLLIGTTSGVGTGVNGWEFRKTSGQSRYGASGTSSNVLTFYTSSGLAGRISVSGTTTSYQTSSDYRLKENVTDLTGAITRVKNLSPKRFNFTGFTDTVDGFLAHEAQTVVPESVSGTHNETEAIGDITDADSNTVETGVVEPDTLEDGHTWTETGTQPVYQGIDQAKLVPLLTAALQEAITKIEDLETRLTALEAE